MTTKESDIVQLLIQIRDGAIDRTVGLTLFEQWIRNRREFYVYT